MKHSSLLIPPSRLEDASTVRSVGDGEYYATIIIPPGIRQQPDFGHQTERNSKNGANVLGLFRVSLFERGMNHRYSGTELTSKRSYCGIGELFRKKLQRDITVQLEFFRFAYWTHPTATELLGDALVRDGFADHGGLLSLTSFRSGWHAALQLFKPFQHDVAPRLCRPARQSRTSPRFSPGSPT